MRVFLSWSGEKSRLLAEALRNWLPNVHQQIEIFFSPNDIEKGARWATEIEAQLRDTQYCLICLTPEAIENSWIAFEAGAISKGLGQNRISPLLFDLSKTQVPGPLALFQLADFNKAEMFKVLGSINASFEDDRLNDEILNRAFDRWWPDLESEVGKILKETPSTERPRKTPRDLSEEILLNTREIIKLTSRQTRNSTAIGLMVNANQRITRLHQTSVAEGYTEVLATIRRLGQTILSLNDAVGEKKRRQPQSATNLG